MREKNKINSSFANGLFVHKYISEVLADVYDI